MRNQWQGEEVKKTWEKSGGMISKHKENLDSKLVTLKKNYYNYLDRKAGYIAYQLSKSKKVTKLFLDYIKELYECENRSKELYNTGNFESAYHNPISSDLEFLVSRVLYHYSNIKKLNWKIYLRKQRGEQKKTKKKKKLSAPDIRIEKNGRTLAIIEVKAKAGWIQSFFSDYLIEKYRREGNTSKIKDCKESIKKQKEQLKKYSDSFGIEHEQVFFFLPSLKQVHRETKSSMNIGDYYKQFSDNSHLPEGNLILLSHNLSLDLSSNHSRKEYNPTNRFEDFIHTFIEKLNNLGKNED